MLYRNRKPDDPNEGKWLGIGGKIEPGETADECNAREVLEETGLDVSGAEGGYVFSYHRENPGTGDNYFVDIFKYVMDFDESDVKIQEEEALGFMLADHDKIKALADEGIFLHYDSIKRVFE